VLACGSWSSQVAGALAPDAIEPVRGVVVELRGAELRHVIFGDGGYLVPRGDAILVGSTEEHCGFQRAVDRAGAERQLARAARLCPRLADAQVSFAWCNFRPTARDGLPLVGADEVDGLFLATGHYRNGILLAPVTAAAIAALVTGERPPVDLAPFAGARLAPTRS
jgi:glycine oxidase